MEDNGLAEAFNRAEVITGLETFQAEEFQATERDGV